MQLLMQYEPVPSYSLRSMLSACRILAGLNHFALETKLVMGRNNMHEGSDSADTGSAVSAAVPDV